MRFHYVRRERRDKASILMFLGDLHAIGVFAMWVFENISEPDAMLSNRRGSCSIAASSVGVGTRMK